MATTEGTNQDSSVEELDRIIDVGAQVQEQTDDILPYVDADTASREFAELSPNPRAEIYGGPSAFPIYEYKQADENGEIIEDGPITEPIHADSLDEMQQSYGIDTSVVSPTLNLSLPEVNNDRFAYELSRGYNRWLVDELAGHEDLVGNMVLAPQHPERAADEIDDMADEDSIVGIHLPLTGLTPPAGHRVYNPIYEAAEKHDLPITLQGTVGIKSFHNQVYSSDYYAMDHSYHQPFLIMQHLTSITFEGVVERYPGVDFVLLDSGASWAPYLIMRMDDHYLELGYEVPVLEKLPSEYLKESAFWGSAPTGHSSNNPTDDYLAKMFQMAGENNVLYSSDIPHPVTESPTSVFQEIEPHFDEDELNSIFGASAADLYDL